MSQRSTPVDAWAAAAVAAMLRRVKLALAAEYARLADELRRP